MQQQLLLATGCPGVVLYGRRRVGKSSVLGNLDGFLPDTVHTAVVSLQDPRAFSSLSGLCGELHAAIGRSLSKALQGAQLTANEPPQTYPTMMGLINEASDGPRQYGPGHFDLFIIDASRRSRGHAARATQRIAVHGYLPDRAG